MKSHIRFLMGILVVTLLLLGSYQAGSLAGPARAAAKEACASAIEGINSYDLGEYAQGTKQFRSAAEAANRADALHPREWVRLREILAEMSEIASTKGRDGFAGQRPLLIHMTLECRRAVTGIPVPGVTPDKE